MKATGSIEHVGQQWQGIEPPAGRRAAWVTSLTVPRVSSLLLAAGIAGAVAIFLLQVVLIFDYTVDDAFISYRYAESLANGMGLVFNEGEQVEGYTNFLWVLMLAGAAKLGAGPEMASKALGLAFAFGTMAVAWLLGRALRQPPHAIVGLTALALLAVNPAFASWAVGGLETMSMAFFVTLGVYLYLKEQRGGAPLSALPLLAAALTRPEGFGLWAVTMIHRLIVRWRSSPQDRTSIQKELAFVGLFLVPYVAFLTWRLAYYGALLPNTYYARGGGGIEQLRGGLLYGFHFATEPANIVFWLIVPFVWLAWRKGGLTSKHNYLSLVITSYFGYIVLAGSDWMPSWRFFVPVLPLMAVMAQDVVAQVWRSVASRAQDLSSRSIALAAAGFAIAVLLLLSGITFARSYDTLIGWQVAYNQANRTTALFLSEQAGPDATFGVMDAGVLPYYSGLQTIDLAGLTDSHIGRLPGKLTHKTDVDYVLDKQPAFVQLHLYGTFPLRPMPTEAQAGLPSFEDARLFELPEDVEIASLVGYGPFLTNAYVSSERFRREYHLWFAYWPNSQDSDSGRYILIFSRIEALAMERSSHE